MDMDVRVDIASLACISGGFTRWLAKLPDLYVESIKKCVKIRSLIDPAFVEAIADCTTGSRTQRGVALDASKCGSSNSHTSIPSIPSIPNEKTQATRVTQMGRNK
jgi:hypothetical protein